MGNVAVGFDLLGHALTSPYDLVAVRRHRQPGVRIGKIEGIDETLPRIPAHNTASRAVQSLLDHLDLTIGLEIDIAKGIPLASGLGGSAASAVAAVVAAADLLNLDWPRERLYPFALAGEAVASGASHGDNVGCQLLGGLVLATHDRLVPIPVPEGIFAVVVHPEHQVSTRDARRCLAEPFDLPTVVDQSACLAQVLAGCHQSDPALIRAGLRDVMIEPRRAGLIPGFTAVKQAALEHDALGASISGAGPTVFGWFADRQGADSAGAAMVDAFATAGLSAEAFVSPVAAPGARIVERG